MSHPVETLELDNIILEPFSEKYITEEYLSWVNDPEVTKYLEIRFQEHDMEGLRSYVNSIDWKRTYLYAIIDKETNQHIGNASLNNIDKFHQTFGASFFIGNKEFWGSRNAELVNVLLVNYGFEKLGLRKYFAGTYSSNFKANFLMRKLGYEVEYIKKEAYLFEDRVVDQIVYGITADKWDRIRSKYFV